MSQRYKLRLGDGTVLAVDSDGLRGWAADGRAMVQAVGSWRWQPLQEVLAEEAAAAKLAQALVPPTPRQEPTAPPAAPPSPPVELPSFGRPALAVESRPSLQVLADEPVSSRYADPGATPAADDVPVIRLKPLDDEPASPAVWSARYDEEEDDLSEHEPRYDRLDGPLLTVLETFGGFLSRCLDPLAPLVRGVRFGSSGQPAPRRAPEQEPDRATLYARVSAWLRGLRSGARRSPRAEGSERAAAAPFPGASRPQALLPRDPVPAPAPISELPVLRFVESHEPREEADLYEGEEPSFGLGPAWLWTKRIVVVGALAAGFAFAVLERDTWLPRAATLGQAVFAEIDRLVFSRQRSEQRRRALAEAAERLPGLAPETVQLIFSRSPTGAVPAPEAFQLAREAADRGRTALTAAEAKELRELERELLGALPATQRQQVQEYDRTRTRRELFPFENPHVMELVAGGARALPPERRARLQLITHKAVTAGIAVPAGTAAPSAAR